jgi:hypothetical protein
MYLGMWSIASNALEQEGLSTFEVADVRLAEIWRRQPAGALVPSDMAWHLVSLEHRAPDDEIAAVEHPFHRDPVESTLTEAWAIVRKEPVATTWACEIHREWIEVPGRARPQCHGHLPGSG